MESTNIREDKSENMNTAVMESTYGHPSKLRRDTPLQSSSSLDSLLESRRPDPVEIFLNLGFGGVPGVDMEQCRIPKRFLVPSKVISEFKKFHFSFKKLIFTCFLNCSVKVVIGMNS